MQQHHQLRAYVRIPQVHLPIDLASHTMTLEDRLEMRTCRARVVVVGVVLERLREAHNIYRDDATIRHYQESRGS